MLGVASAALICSAARAEEDGLGVIEVGVAKANVEAGNQPSATLIDRDFVLEVVATGTDRLENPSGVISQFGLLSSGVRTEPDQNTYVALEKSLVCNGVDYGRNFLVQGHENAGNLAYVTRINLDRKRDDARRITLLTPVGADGLTHLTRWMARLLIRSPTRCSLPRKRALTSTGRSTVRAASFRLAWTVSPA